MEQESISMEVVNPQATGVDVGSRSHWVAVGQSEKDVCEFGVFNQDLFDMADWLKEKNIKTTAMESTGTYWQNLNSLVELLLDRQVHHIRETTKALITSFDYIYFLKIELSASTLRYKQNKPQWQKIYQDLIVFKKCKSWKTTSNLIN
jgi:hypothetical protein